MLRETILLPPDLKRYFSPVQPAQNGDRRWAETTQIMGGRALNLRIRCADPNPWGKVWEVQLNRLTQGAGLNKYSTGVELRLHPVRSSATPSVELSREDYRAGMAFTQEPCVWSGHWLVGKDAWVSYQLAIDDN